MTFGEWLNAHMDELERGDAWVAKKIGKDRVTVHNWRTDKTAPKFDDVLIVVRFLAEQLGISIKAVWDDLFFVIGVLDD